MEVLEQLLVIVIAGGISGLIFYLSKKIHD